MKLGEGARRVGQPCWSHEQCRLSQENSHCTSLVCTCDSGFHQHGHRCTRNLWEDLGLHQWELMLIAFSITLVLLAVFLGCIYCLISRLARYRLTVPAGELVPSNFQDGEPTCKRGSIKKNTVKSIRVLETQLLNETTVKSQMVEQIALTGQQEGRELVLDADKLWPASLTLPATQFILPLEYQHKTTDFQPMKMENGSLSGANTSSMSRQNSSGGSWSSRGWESLSTEPETDSYFPSWRQYRVPVASRNAGRGYRPLLLKTSTFSESDEST
ncbi:uncharacterized protein [Procambarus clarkii]|uniref:uncharacterized protein isoform X1 n=1 Tax=Procambarus clarkii TaxID=6728 RepID=UPI0037441C44